jgi:alkanesulfonate monooxygenase SsuD/methylene tetrahydromethanopterin reductase-like flavin-dependent oxidoreductase (luciferase family)
VNVLAADTTETARQQLQNVRRARAVGMFGKQMGLMDNNFSDDQADQLLAAGAAGHVDHMLTYTATGTPAQVRNYLAEFRHHTSADELITTHQARTIEARLRSATLTAEAMQPLTD